MLAVPTTYPLFLLIKILGITIPPKMNIFSISGIPAQMIKQEGDDSLHRRQMEDPC